MSLWLIEPLDPLIARDGRPAAVRHFRSVAFPYPSMVAGSVRTRMGSRNGAFSLSGNALDELKEKVAIRGPLLAELSSDRDEILQWFAPTPRDAVFLLDEDEHKDRVMLKRLVPRALDDGEAMDSLLEQGLLPVAFRGTETYGKPPKRVPAFWNWSVFESWLTAPQESTVELSHLGIRSLPVETRAHLALQPGERVGIDGMLFQTSGLRFLQEREGTRLQPRRFALSLWCGEAVVAGHRLALERQIAPLGGERRLARWSPASKEWPRMPQAIRDAIVARRRARLILLTPAVFESGALPGWNKGAWPLGGRVEATVRAACVPRPEVVSGWDFAKGRPKKTRRLAPAGSVYFLELSGTEEDLRRWCDDTWLTCVSDDAQDRRDGFGLAALGTWEDA